MKDDEHYHYFHPSVDDYLANRVHGYVVDSSSSSHSTEEGGDCGATSDVSPRGPNNQSEGGADAASPLDDPQGSLASAFLGLSLDDLMQHLSNCFSEMLTFVICILILKRWLCVDLCWPWTNTQPTTDAFLERRSFDPSATSTNNCDTFRLVTQVL